MRQARSAAEEIAQLAAEAQRERMKRPSSARPKGPVPQASVNVDFDECDASMRASDVQNVSFHLRNQACNL